MTVLDLLDGVDLAPAGEDGMFLGMYTAEELVVAAVDAPGPFGVDEKQLERLPQTRREVMLETAARSLAARGALRDIEGAPESAGLGLLGPLAVVVAARREAKAVVAIERTGLGGDERFAAYAADDGLMLLEEVINTGFHAFTLWQIDALASHLVERFGIDLAERPAKRRGTAVVVGTLRSSGESVDAERGDPSDLNEDLAAMSATTIIHAVRRTGDELTTVRVTVLDAASGRGWAIAQRDAEAGTRVVARRTTNVDGRELVARCLAVDASTEDWLAAG